MDPGSVVFGRYLLLERIGTGGTGVVWKATDQRLHQTVALKRVPFAGLDDAQAQLTRDRTLREARLAAQLNVHPHVVTVYDVLADDSDIWLVMEYLPSSSLGEILRTQGRLAPVDAARIGAQVADALAAAHAREIEHRDVKPGNVLIGADGTVKLTDFGISHLAGDPQLTHTGISGTPAYLAPEVAGGGESSPASDIFSLGSTLYAAVESQPPFGVGGNVLRLVNIVRTGIIRPPTHAGPLESLLLRLLQPTPTTRPDAATTRDLLTRLTNPTDRARPAKTARWWRSRWWRSRWWRKPTRRVTVTTAALIAAATATTGVIALRTPPDPAVNPPPSSAASDADPCALINLATLDEFGAPRFLIPPPWLESCHARIKAASGNETHVEVIFDEPPESISELGGTVRQDGDVTIINKKRIHLTHAGTMACQNLLVLANQPLIAINTFDYHSESVDLCAVTDAATTAAVSEIKRRGGIPYRLDRTAEYSYADSNACATLDNTALSKVPGLNPNDREPGFSNWSCSWGTRAQGSPHVSVRFRLDSPDLADHHGEPAPPVLGKPAFLDRYPESCRAHVVHRSTPTATEMFELAVGGPPPTEELCNLAINLATAVGEHLPDR